MTALRTLLAAFVTATGLALVAPAPAFACSCASADPVQFVEWADLVVVGEVTGITPPPEREVMSSGDPATYAVRVERVLAGEAGARIEVQSAVSGASCGLEDIEVGRAYVVFAGHQDIEGNATERLFANLCGGTAPATRAYVARVEAVTGEGVQPQPDEPDDVGAPAASGPGHPGVEQSVSAGPAVPVWAWVGGGLAVVIAAAATSWASARRR